MHVNTRKEAIQFLISMVGKPRTELPWLKGRIKLGDCAAGYTYACLGKTTKIIWVHELVERMKENGTWTTTGTPQPGDAVIYDWNKDGSSDHVAMFHSKNKAGQFIAYGANQGSVHEVSKLVTSKGVIVGWGTPFNFSEPTQKAPVTPVEPSLSKEHILAYQIKKGLPQTGILDEATKARMNK